MRLWKALALALALVMVASFVPSCRKGDGGNTDNPDLEVTEKPQILTNVFKSTPYHLPEEYYFNDSITPYYNAETGELKIFASHSYMAEEPTEENEYGSYVTENLILTLKDGETIDEMKIGFDEADTDVYINISNGVITEDKFIFCSTVYDSIKQNQLIYLNTMKFSDMTVVTSEELSVLFNIEDERFFYINKMAVDGDGAIYLSADSEVVVVDSSFVKLFSVGTQSWIENMTMAPDGKVYVKGYFTDKSAYKLVDKDRKEFGEELAVPDVNDIDELMFGEGYDLFYKTNEGIFGYNFAEEGSEAASELVMNFQNSDVSGDNINILGILSADTVLVSERDPVSYRDYPAMYKKSADIDMSQIKVIEIATDSMPYGLSENVVNFNRENPGARIIITDFDKYNTDENWMAGSEKLARDIVTGIYKPDIVLSNSGVSSAAQVLHDEGLFTDLYTFIDKSSRIKREDMLGFVEKSFEDGDGHLWLIPQSVMIRTILAPRSILGDRTGWTLTEMLDFARSLPEGVELMEKLTSETAPYYILGNNSYGEFIDMASNTCDFENPDFIAYLEYIKTLPKTFDYENYDRDNAYKARHEGKVALDEKYYYSIDSFISDRIIFNTKDIVRVGYPSADGKSGTEITPQLAFVITSFCEYPEDAWAFIEKVIVPEESDFRRAGRDGFPILRGVLEKQFEEAYRNRYDMYFDGSMSWGPYEPEWDDERELDRPGIRTFFTEEDATEIRSWLDNEIGSPVSGENADMKILEIINEEISGYLGGTKSAEDCARVIQSRVSIRLAENS